MVQNGFSNLSNRKCISDIRKDKRKKKEVKYGGTLKNDIDIQKFEEYTGISQRKSDEERFPGLRGYKSQENWWEYSSSTDTWGVRRRVPERWAWIRFPSPPQTPVWCWKSLSSHHPRSCSFYQTIFLGLKEIDFVKNKREKSLGMAFSKHKSTHFIFQSRTFWNYLPLKDSYQGPHDLSVLSRLPMACFTAALLEVFSIVPSLYDLIRNASESQGKSCRLTARASCWDGSCLFVSAGPRGLTSVGTRRKKP